MSAHEMLITVMAVFAVLGGVDRIFGNRFGLGQEFENGILAMGSMGLAMIGIIALAPVLPNFLTEKTTLICSGILDTRLSDVETALTRAGLVITRIHAEEEWRCLELARKDG